MLKVLLCVVFAETMRSLDAAVGNAPRTAGCQVVQGHLMKAQGHATCTEDHRAPCCSHLWKETSPLEDSVSGP